MAKSKSKLDNFITKVRTDYTPRSDKFEVTFTIPGVDKQDSYIFTVMCEEAQLPGLSATNVPYKLGPWTEFRNQNVEFLAQDAVFTFISDGNFEIRNAFESWIGRTVDPYNKEASYYDLIKGQIDIAVLDNQNNIRTEYQLQDAIPKLINITPLAWSNTGHIRISVSFAAKKWTKKVGNSERNPQDELAGRLRGRIFSGRAGNILERILGL